MYHVKETTSLCFLILSLSSGVLVLRVLAESLELNQLVSGQCVFGDIIL